MTGENKWQDWSSQIKGRKCKEIRERNITGGGSADETSSFSSTKERLGHTRPDAIGWCARRYRFI